MSFSTYLKLTGNQQGLISSGCGTSDSIGNRCQNRHENQIQILSLNHSITREENCNHHPVTFVKPIDKSSPLLGVAVSNNEKLTAEFYIYRVNQSGILEKCYSIKITDATITSIDSTYPNVIDSSELMPYETIALKYKSISWQHLIAGTSGYSIWDDRVY